MRFFAILTTILLLLTNWAVAAEFNLMPNGSIGSLGAIPGTGGFVLSPDSTIAAFKGSETGTAYMWNTTTGEVSTLISGATALSVFGVSNTGVAVGNMLASSGGNTQGFKADAVNGITPLTAFSSGASVFGISADGGTLTGSLVGNGTNTGFVVTSSTASDWYLDPFSSNRVAGSSVIRSLSSDGTTAAGYNAIGSDGFTSLYEAFTLDITTGTRTLIPLPEGFLTFDSRVVISGDGSTVGGLLLDTTGDYHVFAYTAEDGLEILPGTVPNGGTATLGVHGFSGDGQYMLGRITGGVDGVSGTGTGGYWDLVTGEFISVAQFQSALTDAGVDFQGKTLSTILAFSADGDIAFGQTTSANGGRELWQVSGLNAVPEPSVTALLILGASASLLALRKKRAKS